MKDERFDILLELAKRGRPEPSAEAPYGFASRVAARWAEAPKQASLADLWERLCWYGAGVSLAALVFCASFTPSASQPNAFEMLLSVPEISRDTF